MNGNLLGNTRNDLRSSLPEHHRATIHKIDPEVLEGIVEKSYSVDKDYADILFCGFRVTNVVAAGGMRKNIEGGQLIHGRLGSKTYAC